MKSLKEKKTMKKYWLFHRALRITTTVFVAVLLLVSAAIGDAAEKKPDDGWKFEITPYVWLPTASGSMKLEPPPGFASGNLDYGPNDYLENLDFAVMLDLQAHKVLLLSIVTV